MDGSRDRISIKHLRPAKSPPTPYVTLRGAAASESLNHLLIRWWKYLTIYREILSMPLGNL